MICCDLAAKNGGRGRQMDELDELLRAGKDVVKRKWTTKGCYHVQ